MENAYMGRLVFAAARRVFALFGLLIGAGALLFGLFSILGNLIFYSHAVATQGYVIGLEPSPTSKSDQEYPVVAFFTPKEQELESQLISDRSEDYTIGESIPILYNPKNPSEVRMNDGWALWFQFVCLSAWGIGVLVFSGLVRLLGKSRLSRGAYQGGPV